MNTLARIITAFLILLPPVVQAQQTDYNKAIAYGQSFKSRLQYLDKGLKDQKIQMASAFATDGMSKYVTFFTDYEVIAASAAQAKQEMREFTIDDAKKLPLTGLVFAHVEVHARGMLPTQRLSKRFVKNGAHMVLEIDGKIIQPLSKELTEVSASSTVLPVGFSSYWQSNNTSLLTGGPMVVESGKAEMEFVYLVEQSMRTKKGKVILIDAEGNKYQQDLDFAKVLR